MKPEICGRIEPLRFLEEGCELLLALGRVRVRVRVQRGFSFLHDEVVEFLQLREHCDHLDPIDHKVRVRARIKV